MRHRQPSRVGGMEILPLSVLFFFCRAKYRSLSVHSSYQSCLRAPTLCLRGDHVVPDLRSVFVLFTLRLLSLPPVADSNARPPRVKFPWRGRDAEQTARASDFAPSYLGLERLTKTNSSGLMIKRGVGDQCSGLRLAHRERKRSHPSSSNSREQLLQVE